MMQTGFLWLSTGTAFVIAVITIAVPRNAGNVLTSCLTISCTRTLIRGVSLYQTWLHCL